VLREAGATVLVNDARPERATAVADAIGGRALPFDVTDRAAVDAAVRSSAPIDILVNNAGIPPSMRAEPFRDQRPDDWAPYVDVNLYGVVHCVKATLDGMCERGWGRIITISSSAGTHGAAIGVALYAAGKGAGISFMRHIALECARSGVTANTLALGLMERADPGAEAARTVTSGFLASIPVGRLGTGTDVGHACVYLASEEASWITGQTIGLNGGSHTS
jgi:NAD(P)-dependent dehydrogenase (short-subunit alcohol dehydrogenase family)